MEHAEALERIEIAAAEPDGLDRLMAGDTADAAAIAGHLAGCPACVAELARIRRSASIARAVILTQPDPALRARTLSFVRAEGVPRGAVATAPGISVVADVAGGPRRMPRLGWIAAAAAIVIVALGAGYLAGAPARDRVETAEREASLLAHVAEATLRIEAQPDATRVTLAPTADAPGAAGTLLYSPSSGELVAIATDLPQTGPGQEYGCWIEDSGSRERIGHMYRAGELWTWAGPVEGLAELTPGVVFGVSVGPAGGSPDSIPMLTGGV